MNRGEERKNELHYLTRMNKARTEIEKQIINVGPYRVLVLWVASSLCGGKGGGECHCGHGTICV